MRFWNQFAIRLSGYRSLVPVLSACCAMALCSPAGAEAPADAPAAPAAPGTGAVERAAIATVADLDQQRTVAMKTVDIPALQRILADDVTYTHSTGVVETRQQFLDSLESGRTKYIAITARESLVRAYGDSTIVITGRSDFHIQAGGRDIQTTLVFTAVYIRRAEKGNWQMVAWHSGAAPAPPAAPTPPAGAAAG